MKTNKIIATSPIVLKITASSIEELCIAVLQAMNRKLKTGFCDQIHRFYCRTQIEVTGSDPSVLMVDFLSAILSLSQEEKVIYCHAQFLQFSEKKITATIFGAPAYQFDHEITSIELAKERIRKNILNQWETSLLFNVTSKKNMERKSNISNQSMFRLLSSNMFIAFSSVTV